MRPLDLLRAATGKIAPPGAPLAGMWKSLLSKPILVVLVAGVAAAAITITYANPSTLTTGVTPAPVQFLPGDDAGPGLLSDYVSAFTISTNRTHVGLTIHGVPEATLTIGSLLKLQNVDDAAHGVVLTTPQVTNAYVAAYTLQVYDAANVLQGTLDLRAASPSVALSLPAGETYHAKLDLRLASGAGQDNVALANPITLTVS